MQSSGDLGWALLSGLVVMVFWIACMATIISRLGKIHDELRGIYARLGQKDKREEPTS